MTDLSSENKKQAAKGWNEEDKAQWRAKQNIKRSYQEQVVAKIKRLSDTFVVEQYGELNYDSHEYPLLKVKNRVWNSQNPVILVTGGVHGYETSGVQGAIRFLEKAAVSYLEHFNFIVLPCISPWGYETINRWNPMAIDPNRSFYEDTPCEESAKAMQAIQTEIPNLDILAHFDLHETTDTDNTEFRPALAARDGVEQDNWNIPDGFYTVGDADNPVDAFQKAIIESVKQVTFIAPNDENGLIIGVKPTQPGVINYATKQLFLCAGYTNCQFATTTEVYPDSPKITDEECILAQVAAVEGGLSYLLD